MLIQSFCPICGGPALTVGAEISCPLCGNQEVVEAEVQETAPIEVPALIEFELLAAASREGEWSEAELAFALEYLLGFAETFQGLPEVEPGGEGEKRCFAPTVAQCEALSQLCDKHEVEPARVMQIATAFYATRE